MKKTIFISVLAVLFLTGILSARASLWNYFQSRGLNLPPVEDRVEIALECGLFVYEGGYYENIMLEECIKDVDFSSFTFRHNLYFFPASTVGLLACMTQPIILRSSSLGQAM